MTVLPAPIFLSSPAASRREALSEVHKPRCFCAPPRNDQSRSPLPLPLPARAWALPNVLVFGKPLGARRPASARLPRQSASSLSDNVKIRPAESTQLRPFSTSKVLMSDSPPFLYRC